MLTPPPITYPVAEAFEHEARLRLRSELLLEIVQAATSTLELEEILRLAVEKVGRAIKTDRCSVVLVEGHHPTHARVVASLEVADFKPVDIELARYPEVRHALETRQALHIEDATHDPLVAEVRESILPMGVTSFFIQPLVCQDDLLGALFLRLSRPDASFGPEEQEFARTVGAALANSIRNARLHKSLRKKRDDLESAYVDRYRELAEANRRLRDLNRLKDDIIAVCSHDLRAPLNVLLGHGKLMLADREVQGQHRSSTEAMVRQGEKILALVESLLERGKGEAARVSLLPTRLDIGSLVDEAVKELSILADQRDLTVTSHVEGPLKIVGDSLKLNAVLQNLITNAIQHASTAGEVRVEIQRQLRPDGDVARISVTDNGEGIPEEQLPLLFDRYRHGPKAGEKSAGLGLAICKEFVELHGGEIWAERAPGGGTSFIFTLPLALEEGATSPIPPGVLRRRQGMLPHVLVVEDEPQVAAILAEILRSRYRVDVARDGAEGLAKARDLHPDLVVMDVFLPKLDGLDAAVALQASSDTADIPVILLSAHRDVASKLSQLNLGAVDYLTKPFQTAELLSRVERALVASGALEPLPAFPGPPTGEREVG
jgi:two-component system sensor histidine kinase ChiS